MTAHSTVIRTPDQRVRVFVSSTLRELTEERRVVHDAIRRLQLTPVMFELSARPHPARELYRSYLAQSQIFIGLYWQQYGWTGPGEAISGLEDEYELSAEMPRLLYVKEPAPEREPALEGLVRRFEADDAASYRVFSTAGELAELVSADLALLLSERFQSDRQPPAGTITFLFTDIEGSTRRWEAAPDVMGPALARHDEILRDVIERCRGYVFKTVGDAFCAAFQDPEHAVEAAVEIQRALADEPLGPSSPLSVRIALHTGAAEQRDGDYFGQPLSRVARLLSAGHGGQVLLSHVVAELVQDSLSADLSLRDLGTHRLRDLSRAMRIYQLVAPGVAADFPPLRTLDTLRHNLPTQLSSFVGRNEELARLREGLADARLVTLTGVGGSGKSRLALQAAEELMASYPDGVWLVELATVSEPEAVAVAVLDALGVREQPWRSAQETLTEQLRDTRLLLLLDNCEHVLQACADLAAAALRTTSGVRILATSREGLGVPGEVILAVPSLPFPQGSRASDPEELLGFPAVELFVERVRTVRPDFELTDDGAPAVLRIVQRLDGIPLALELAAARTRVLSVEQIAERLVDRFRLLTGGSRTVLPRQQTLQAAMDWSHDLLSNDERVLLRRLSVFAGGWTLDAAELVCAGGELDTAEILDLLGRLVDKSLVLVVADSAEHRYRLLETVRQYGLQRLLDADELPDLRDAHGRWCLELASEAAPAIQGGVDQTAWMDRLQAERDNLRAALEWLLECGSVHALTLTTDLAWFWYLQGHWRDAQDWLERGLEIRGVAPELHIRARGWAGVFAWRRGDTETARRCVDTSLEALRSTADPEGWGIVLLVQALLAMTELRHDAAEGFSRRAHQVFCQIDHRWGMAISLLLTAQVGIHRASPEASAVLEESIELLRETSDSWGRAYATSLNGQIALEADDLERAEALYADALRLAAEARDPSWQAQMHMTLAHVQLLRGAVQAAARQLDDASPLVEHLGDPHELAHLQEVMALVQVANGDQQGADELFRRAADNLRHHGNRPAMGTFAAETAHRYERHGHPRIAAALLGYALMLLDAHANPTDADEVRARLAALAHSEPVTNNSPPSKEPNP